MSTIQGAPVTRESRCMSRVTWGVMFGVSHGTPTRPDPTRPIKYSRGYVCMHRWVPNARVADDAMRGATR